MNIYYLLHWSTVHMHQQSKKPKNASVLHWRPNLHTKRGRNEKGVLNPGPAMNKQIFKKKRK